MKKVTPSPRATKPARWPRTMTSRSEAETERIAARLAKTLRGGEVILLDGDLGAGKTAFVRGLAHSLGVRDRITSPTFVLMRIHKADSREPIARSNRNRIRHHAIGSRLSAIGYFVHVDAYRVNDPNALETIGLLEWAGKPDTIVAIEWGARAQPLFRGQQIRRVSIAPRTKNPSIRSIRIS